MNIWDAISNLAAQIGTPELRICRLETDIAQLAAAVKEYADAEVALRRSERDSIRAAIIADRL